MCCIQIIPTATQQTNWVQGFLWGGSQFISALGDALRSAALSITEHVRVCAYHTWNRDSRKAWQCVGTV